MMSLVSLGTRPAVEVESLEDRIARRLNEALDRQVAGRFENPDAERGLAAVDHDVSELGVIRLSVQDVARIAAQEAKAWF